MSTSLPSAQSLFSDDLVPLARLADKTPKARSGKKRHRSAFYRYVKHGIRGIRLRAWKLPDGLYSSMAAWDFFVSELTLATCKRSNSPSTSPSAAAKRDLAIDREIALVRKSLHRHDEPRSEGPPATK